ncbi:MAG: hypothetical protein GY779_05125, partial [Gammaproteobacteria bacterium]|nr:hypothetical protein [Gammaproteobacteria bacterium]
DPVYSAWDKSTGISITESQVSDLTHFTTADETDPQVGANTANYISKWNGTALVTGTIYDNGNVGIGSSNPNERLEVVDAGTRARVSVRGDSGATNLTGIDMEHTGTNTRKWLVGVVGSALQGAFAVVDETAGNQVRFVIDRLGRIGIGTHNPQGKLDVNGAIYQRGGVLHADYVFEDNYKLESIKDHADFMWKNKHLEAI